MAKVKVKFPEAEQEMSASDGTKYQSDKKGQAVVSSAHLPDLQAFGVKVVEVLREQTDEERAEDELAAKIESIRKGNVGEVQAALDALSDDELARLEVAEQAADKPRAGVLGAIEAVKASRAEAAKAKE